MSVENSISHEYDVENSRRICKALFTIFGCSFFFLIQKASNNISEYLSLKILSDLNSESSSSSFIVKCYATHASVTWHLNKHQMAGNTSSHKIILFRWQWRKVMFFIVTDLLLNLFDLSYICLDFSILLSILQHTWQRLAAHQCAAAHLVENHCSIPHIRSVSELMIVSEPEFFLPVCMFIFFSRFRLF